MRFSAILTKLTHCPPSRVRLRFATPPRVRAAAANLANFRAFACYDCLRFDGTSTPSVRTFGRGRPTILFPRSQSR
jgi:hypothetical protein